ncbi:ferredoxin [Mycobacterium sherrisii]|uniref:Ferredoxin n=1 Tax=Mycobacterium sherrisii TaxID=243061 RepID=A0A1E3SP31_9MYCO|nr:ferredoxin [Mycobacterium sherrisii]MCV7032330.1 ferredoxin [Mycobacterium sherrisii]ODR03900.1 ferredoxin [Mycobacterium sherrisii]ORW74613.1 ferredoxin [Mycobacterium sherrisii]
MKVHVNAKLCQGHNRCLMFDTDVFEVDELSYAHVRGDGSVPPGEEESVRLAVVNCPEQAITVSDE